jgi:hypothetical protein
MVKALSALKETLEALWPFLIGLAYVAIALSVQSRWVGHPNYDPWGRFGLLIFTSGAWLLCSFSLWRRLGAVRAALAATAVICIAFLAFVYVAASLWGS